MSFHFDLAVVPLVGIGPIVVISAIALAFLIFTALLWRGHRGWRWVTAILFVLFALGAVADWVNTKFAYYDTAADLFGIPNYPTVEGNVNGPEVKPQPNGAVIDLGIPDTASKFGQFPAKVWLPPQYFTDQGTHFPVQVLIAGNPGDPTNWLGTPRADATALKAAQAGKPVILVMPQALQNTVTGDSLCLDTASQGKAETYLTQDVIAAVDDQLRTIPDAKHRGIGGLSMGGFCALNLGLKHPDLFSVALDFSGETKPVADTLPGGLQDLFGEGWQQKADAADPTKYVSGLNGKNGPAIWMDVGTSDTQILADMRALAPQLQARGYTVEVHTRPGAHDFQTWGDGFADAFPWATARYYS